MAAKESAGSIGPVKDSSNLTYSPSNMVDHFYMPFRKGKMVPGERHDIESIASAYKLDPEGLSLLATYMDSITLNRAPEDKIKRVPPKADEIAKELATVKPRKKAKTPSQPYIVEGYGAAPTQLNTYF